MPRWPLAVPRGCVVVWRRFGLPRRPLLKTWRCFNRGALCLGGGLAGPPGTPPLLGRGCPLGGGGRALPLPPLLARRMRWHPCSPGRVERANVGREGLRVAFPVSWCVVPEELVKCPVVGLLVGLALDHLGVYITVEAEGATCSAVDPRVIPWERVARKRLVLEGNTVPNSTTSIHRRRSRWTRSARMAQMSRMVVERRSPVMVKGHASWIFRFRRLISRRNS